jgi:predicted DNA-binding protein
MAKRGRKKVIENPKELVLIIEGAIHNRLEQLSEKTGMSMSRLGRNLLISGLEDIELLEKAGILTIAIKLRDYQERIRKARDVGYPLERRVVYVGP